MHRQHRCVVEWLRHGAVDSLCPEQRSEYCVPSHRRRTVERVRKKLNPELTIAGILVTMYNSRTVHAREVLEEVRRTFGDKVFPMVVKSSVRFKEAPAAGLSILDYDAAHDGAVAYRDLARRLIK